jgi:hypothetical protein
MDLMGHTRLWNWQDLSTFLNIRISTLKKWHFQHRLPSIRLGAGRHALIRFVPEKIEAWLKEQEFTPGNND